MNSKSLGQKIFHFPLTRIIVGIIVLLLIVAGGQLAFSSIADSFVSGRDIKRFLSGIIAATLAICTYILLFRFYEKRSISELSVRGQGKNLIIGTALGAVLQSMTILVIFVMGGFTVLSVNSPALLLPAFTMAFTAAIFEEILVRGIIFRIMEEKLGSYLALFISALIFGALHLLNPNSSVSAALGLALQAGVLLGAAYIYTRNLWFPIAIHFAWNFTQGGIFGANVSGGSSGKSLLTTKIEGAEWFTGGAFGPEGSVQATVFCVAAAVVLLRFSERQGKIIRPFWKAGI